MKRLVLVAAALALAGCLQFDARAAAAGGAQGAAAGFIGGGPIGAILGGITTAIAGGFAIKKHGQVTRRERIIRHYRSACGDIHAETFKNLN